MSSSKAGARHGKNHEKSWHGTYMNVPYTYMVHTHLATRAVGQSSWLGIQRLGLVSKSWVRFRVWPSPTHIRILFSPLSAIWNEARSFLSLVQKYACINMYVHLHWLFARFTMYKFSNFGVTKKYTKSPKVTQAYAKFAHCFHPNEEIVWENPLVLKYVTFR